MRSVSYYFNYFLNDMRAPFIFMPIVKPIKIISLLQQSFPIENTVRTKPKATNFNGCPIHHSDETYEMKWRFITHEAEMLLVKMHASLSFFLSNGLFCTDTWRRHSKMTMHTTHVANVHGGCHYPKNSNVPSGIHSTLAHPTNLHSST